MNVKSTHIPADNENSPDSYNGKWYLLISTLLVFVVLCFLSPPEGLSREGWLTAAVALLMAAWWVGEVIPIFATALLPLVLFPVLQISPISETAAPYAHPMIFLFMGGFILAIAMQRWNLHRRIALNIIALIGSKPRHIIGGFIVSSAFMSMWVSNTAATIMMLPIALSVIELTKNKVSPTAEEIKQFKNFGLVLMLAIAFSSSVGGLGTVIGTPTNALLIAFVDEAYGIEISFAEWMMIGLPVVLLGLPVIFYTLANIVYPVKLKSLPGGSEYLKSELEKLGQLSSSEKRVAVIFIFVAVMWLTRPLLSDFIPGLTDAGIAIFGALILFITPSKSRSALFLMNWKSAEKLPWGVLILFGGGLSLAGAIQRTGLAEWIGGYFTIIGGWPVILIIFTISFVIIIFTEMASNSATAAAFLPIMGSVAVAVGMHPLLLAIPVAVVASCAFMLPVATPPNAIIYGSGLISIPEMVKAGFLLNIFFALLVTLLAYFLFPIILGIDVSIASESFQF